MGYRRTTVTFIDDNIVSSIRSIQLKLFPYAGGFLESYTQTEIVVKVE